MSKEVACKILELKCCGGDINIASKLQDNVSDIEFYKGWYQQ
ncbi:hypothetical protein [uncultured Campylobacter sp.]|nr:hypothetical protein [uncultured Campylobacter sp.]